MNYTHEIPEPEKFKARLISTLKANGVDNLANRLSECKIAFNDVGWAYYAGVRSGDVWDKDAVDITIYTSEDSIKFLNPATKSLKEWINRMFVPEAGLLARNITFIPLELDDLDDVSLPQSREEDLETLSRDITEALNRNEPTLVLDRLHTFSVKLVRTACNRHKISVNDDKGDLYPLHSLVGLLRKFYKDKGILQSDFTEQALKMSTSLFERFNYVRNNQSFAHDNTILNDIEATYVVKIMAATISFIDEIEKTSIIILLQTQ